MTEILIIDDDVGMRRLVTRILKGAGYTVRDAVDGRDGLQKFRERRPALVITDIVMPDQEGIETILELRREEPTMPILVVSGAGGHEMYLRLATSLGATEALAKPFTVADLLSAVAKLLVAPG